MIQVHNLCKRFPTDQGDLLAVDKVSFEVGAGEVYGLLGPNGAGKTTTLRIILGLLQPCSGYAEVDGVQTSANPDQVKARIGFVSAGAGLYQWLTVREFLLFFADVYGVPDHEAKATLERLTGLLDLGSFINQRCATLSTGQKQRVVLARGLIHQPPVMMLDEPTRGLDVAGSQVIFDYIRHLREEGKSVIVCTHRLDQAQRICDRFGLLQRGRMIHEGSLAELQAATGRRDLVEIFLDILQVRTMPTESPA